MLLWMFQDMKFVEYVYAFLLSTCLGEELLSHRVGGYWDGVDITKDFSILINLKTMFIFKIIEVMHIIIGNLETSKVKQNESTY